MLSFFLAAHDVSWCMPFTRWKTADIQRLKTGWTMAVGSIPTCNWAQRLIQYGLGLMALGHQSLLHYFLVSFPIFGSWVESFFLFFYLLMFGGLYLHLSVRHISICVLVCVASPLFVLCNYHLAHYNSHFGRGAPRNIRSLVGHKSNMTLLSWWTYPPQLSHDKFPGWLVMIWELPGRGLW